MNDPVQSLPQEALAAGVDRLHLDRKSRNALAAVGIGTVGELTVDGYLRQEAWDSLGIDAGKQVSSVLRQLASCVDGDSVDWIRLWTERGISVIPNEISGDSNVAGILAALPQLVHAALIDDAKAGTDPERDWVIVDARNGLVSAPKTLEEIGYGALGITRARVQQLEAKAMVRLRRAWDERFQGTMYRLHSLLGPALDGIAAQVPEPSQVACEGEIHRELGLADRLNDREEHRLKFLLELGGGTRADGDGERRPALWHGAGDTAGRSLIALADRIGRLMTETADAMTETDIVVELNRGHRTGFASLAEARAAVSLCRVGERLDDGRWQSRFEFLTGRGDQAFRIIAAAGRPLDLDIIVRDINARSRGRQLNVRNLANQLSEDARFVSIGKSGEWGLAAEHAQDARPIVEMMTEALRRAGHPLPQAEISAGVAARRKVADASVPMYLQLRPEFTRLANGNWALSEWPEALHGAAPKVDRKPRLRRQPMLADRMADVLIPYLQAAPQSERDLADVAAYVSETLGIIRNTVYAYINRIPSVARVDRDGRQRVRLVEALTKSASPEADTVRRLIATGETPRVEFKSTLRWDVKQGADNPGLQKMCTKTIAAVSNSTGGTLVIGVAPDGSINGIELDCAVLLRKDDTCVDAFSRALAAIVSQHLGGGVAARVRTHYQTLDGKTVCIVEVPPAKEPVYLRDGKSVELYVRIGTTSRALDLPDVAPYISSHWS